MEFWRLWPFWPEAGRDWHEKEVLDNGTKDQCGLV